MEQILLELYTQLQKCRAEGIDPKVKYGEYLVARIEEEFNKIDKNLSTTNQKD